jgi:hypothetical protein
MQPVLANYEIAKVEKAAMDLLNIPLWMCGPGWPCTHQEAKTLLKGLEHDSISEHRI